MPDKGCAAADLDRRLLLKWLASGGLALSASACGPPEEEIVPYVEIPEGLTPGVPLHFATALPLSGYARGALVTSQEGRPTKVEGNPLHPASLGATDIFSQAAVMSLYQPDRAKAVSNAKGLSSWDAFSTALFTQMQREKASNGSGLRILTGRVTSPTLLRQLQGLLKSFPEARWFRYEPVHDDAALAGASQAFGRPLTPLPRMTDASVVVALGADPLGPGPDQIRLAAGYAQSRQTKLPLERVMRLYAAESSWSLTGINADERLALAPNDIHNLAIEISRAFGSGLPSGELPEKARRFADAMVAALQAKVGRAMVLAGREQAPEIHALCCWINAQLQAPIDYIAPVDSVPSGHGQSLRDLAEDLAHKRVETLIVIDSNPAYASPAELRIAELIAAAPFSAHLGLREDETSALCTWRLPLAHTLESWSDLRAFEGTASIVQPLIRPLYDTRTAHQLLAALGGSLSASSYDIVRETWRDHGRSSEFAASWREWLHDGVIPNTSEVPVPTPTAQRVDIQPAVAPKALTLSLAPDPSIWDGSFSNNPWLQECPKPLTKEVWGNALHISPRGAAELGLEDGDVVSLTRNGFATETPVQVVRGQADGVLCATVGYGRTRAGAIGNGVGFNAYALQTPESPWLSDDVKVAKTAKRKEVLTTQHSFKLEAEDKDILPTLTFAALDAGEASVQQPGNLPSLLPAWNYESYKWAMVIDTTACIGCNACLVACQSENNVPIVGPDEVAMGRIMHWLRVDVYFPDDEASPLGFQPVPCMHCEYAPCEPVCPVAASVHDSEGLNVQVYNRCVGTRFCQSNCPYKVRRFNFFGYADGEAYANLDADPVKAHFNPDVSVRARGVMEKCTYCVQRISRARRQAEEDKGRIPVGGVVTACQAACPTRAITFGDLNDPASSLHELRKEPRHYALLGHLGTKPRTTYLARVKNPDPCLHAARS